MGRETAGGSTSSGTHRRRDGVGRSGPSSFSPSARNFEAQHRMPPAGKMDSEKEKDLNVKQTRTEMLRDMLEYTNESNPFGDSKLTEKFVWGKKMEMDEATNKRKKLSKAEQIVQNAEKIAEIQKIRKRREERDQERAELEAQRDQLEREKAIEENRDLFAREDDFQYKQTLERAQMRIQQRRENLVDLMTTSLLVVDGDIEKAKSRVNTYNSSGAPSGARFELVLPDMDPVAKIESVPRTDLETILEIAEKVEDHIHVHYWDSLQTVLRHQLDPSTIASSDGNAGLSGADQRVDADVHELLEGQSQVELEQTKTDLTDELRNPDDTTDVSFYQSVLDKLPLYQARCALRWTHFEALRLAREAVAMQTAGVQAVRQSGGTLDADARKAALLNAKDKADRYGGENIWGNKREIVAEALDDVKDLKVVLGAGHKSAAQAGGTVKSKGDGEQAPRKKKEQSRDLVKQHLQAQEAREKGHVDALVELEQGGAVDGDGKKKKKKVKFVDGSSPEKSNGQDSSDESDEDDDELNPEEVEEEEEVNLSPRSQPLKSLKQRAVLDERTGIQKTVALRENVDYIVVDAEEDAKTRLKNYQNLMLRFGAVLDEKGDRWVDDMRRRGLKDGEMAFNTGQAEENQDHGIVQLAKIHYDWEKKYRPRKPRFFNRVKTGFWWNKYNSTHYDTEVPPPKVVQGYRFNIFYPDLVDKRDTPKYYLEKSDSQETVLIRFSAGPPYEDIAFKIVNKEWNISTRRGFRCVFDRGVLQLYFNFKGFNYRR
ncbi:unnamed protein product [Amoebophrya sp. A25]|nr:unnamed protein product [Amoebophrya sp. A25]|eukprot:GSA25T00018704001.1